MNGKPTGDPAVRCTDLLGDYESLPGETAAKAADRIEAESKGKSSIRVSKLGPGWWVVKELERRGFSVIPENIQSSLMMKLPIGIPNPMMDSLNRAKVRSGRPVANSVADMKCPKRLLGFMGIKLESCCDDCAV